VLVALALLLNRLSNVLLPFAIGWLLAYLLHPVVLFFENTLRIRIRALSILCTVLLLSAIIFGITWIAVPLITSEVDRFTQIVVLHAQNIQMSDFFL
jgi:predicted PurR-regulated permease PerM